MSTSASLEQISEKSSEILKSGNYSQLESSLNQARESRERLTGGYWKLYAIYSGLATPNVLQNASDAEWQAHLARLDEWSRSSPDSISARVALAESWLAYGAEARGDGFANTVSDDNMRLYQERTAKALEVLTQAKAIATKCPEWYSAMLGVGIAQGWKLSKFDAVFEEGFAFEPTYYHLQRIKVSYLLPQWYGKEGDVGRFITEISSRINGDEGEIMYFELLCTLQPAFRGGIFELSGLSWPRAKAAYAILKNQYGVDIYRRNNYLYLATYGLDVDTSIEAAGEVGGEWDERVWGSKRQFDQTVNGLEMMRKAKMGQLPPPNAKPQQQPASK